MSNSHRRAFVYCFSHFDWDSNCIYQLDCSSVDAPECRVCSLPGTLYYDCAGVPYRDVEILNCLPQNPTLVPGPCEGLPDCM